MAVSEIIGAAVGVILLIIVAYVIVSGTLFAGETMANTQKDLTLQQEARLRTALTLTNVSNATGQRNLIFANITNTGTEIISDFKHMEVIVYDYTSKEYEICNYTSSESISTGRWRIKEHYTDFIHPNELDPGEIYQIELISDGELPTWFQITTGNGVSASASYMYGV